LVLKVYRRLLGRSVGDERSGTLGSLRFAADSGGRFAFGQAIRERWTIGPAGGVSKPRRGRGSGGREHRVECVLAVEGKVARGVGCFLASAEDDGCKCWSKFPQLCLSKNGEYSFSTDNGEHDAVE